MYSIGYEGAKLHKRWYNKFTGMIFGWPSFKVVQRFYLFILYRFLVAMTTKYFNYMKFFFNYMYCEIQVA